MPVCSKPNFLKSKILFLETLHPAASQKTRSILVSNYTAPDKYKHSLRAFTYIFSSTFSSLLTASKIV